MSNIFYKKTICATAIISALNTYGVNAAETVQEETTVILVESTKLDTPLGQVNSSVIIKTAEELENSGIYDVRDLTKIFPGLILNTAGNRTYTHASIRGISSGDDYTPSISIYLDGVLQDNSFLAQQLINVERVELLRGPQGSLYGGAAQGGVINIITKKASDQSQFKIGMLYSNLSQQLDISAAGKIGNNTHADITARYVYDQGTISSATSGENDINDATERSIKTRFHYLPENTPLAMTLSIAADNLDSHEELYLTEEQYAKSETTYDDQELLRDVYTYSLNTEYDFGNTKLTSITSFQDREIEREYAYGDWKEDQNKLTQEIRLNTSFGQSLTTLVGAYIERRDLLVETSSNGNNDLGYETYALFSEANYLLTNEFDLTVGARASYIKVGSDYDSAGYSYSAASYDTELSETTLSPKISLGWQVNNNSRLYTSFTQGYKAAGYTVVPATDSDYSTGYDAETSLNAELGWRTNTSDHQLEFNGAFYWVKTDDIQSLVGDVGSQYTDNLGEALSKGIELELTYNASANLSLSLAGTFGESTYEDDTDDLEGNSVAYAPDTTVTIGVEYLIPQSFIKGDISVASHARYNSKTYFDSANTSSQDAYTLINLSINYEYNDNLSLSLFSNNLTDETYVTYNNDAFGINTYGDGREVGLKVNYSW